MQSEISKIMPCIADKFVIEIANSIQVSQDHVRVQSSRLGKVARLVDSFTGAGQQRQQQINQNMTMGLNATCDWLNALTSELALGFSAIQVANQKIIEVQDAVTDLAEFSMETRDLLSQLSANLHLRCDELDQRLSLVEAENKAERQITLLFKQWETHGFEQLSPLLRLYTVLERLYWGDFGDYYKYYHQDITAQKTIRDLTERICLEATQRLLADKQSNKNDFFHPLQWAEQPEVLSLDLKESYAFMGDWAIADKMPINHFASQQPDQLSLHLPRVLTAEGLARCSLNEMFGVR
ncbi:diguanylate cyclase regulator RdcB family protein [Acinetobacter rudis]|uniref:Diguanylate cyclase regulator RdcB family protein n=1 Tax=Acinetobacter rudis TaxID=632955 RepID=A0AAW8JCD9_9GAMM|nr:diguanylate cyclase regulator RdcB family protein [Acinetobacter rudis]MDQ8936250.1 diguanylate cyclase regulator RdcB family protein [Acinetobacter rudis]MDQ9018513.1 diguanylate cyclase regulator RdcB family protein [Acinetobacter rudis]